MQLSKYATRWLADHLLSATCFTRAMENKLGNNPNIYRQPLDKTNYYISRIASILVLSLALWGGNLRYVSALENSPTVDDFMFPLARLSGQNCTITDDLGLHGKQSAIFELEIPGTPVAAYLVWSGRDRDNQGDDIVLLNGQPVLADNQEHGESGGGSWWHTYTHDVSDFVISQVPRGGLLTLTISGLTIESNLGGENHGAGLVVLYASDQCGESETILFSGLDSFKRTAPAAIYGPHSAVHCASVSASQEARQMDLQLHLGGIEDAERNATVWLMTSAEAAPPSTLIGREEALSFVDPVGNEPEMRRWDRFFASIELPSEQTQTCVQIESGGSDGVSAVLVTLMVQVHGASTGGGTNSISGRLWLDADQNGVQDDREAGIPNLVVLLRDAVERTIHQAFVTGPSGDYRFVGLMEGDYTVDVAEELFTTDWRQTGSIDDVLDTEVLVSLAAEMKVEDINFGFVPIAPTGRISGTVWQDANANGIFEDDGDGRLEAVTVQLLDRGQNVVAEQMTNERGIFTFSELAYADYAVQIDTTSLPAESAQTFETDGSLNGSVKVALSETTNSADVSFGYGLRGHTSGRIWHDQNNDGLLSEDESGLENVLLLLTDSLGVGRVAATQNGGRYQFDSLPVGNYVLRVIVQSIRPGAEPTFDVDGTLDLQTSFEVAENTILTNINFGFGFGVRGLEVASPQIDIALSGVDLNDSDALLNYLTQRLDGQSANDKANPPIGQKQTATPADGANSPNTPPSAEEPAPAEDSGQIDGVDEKKDNSGTEGKGRNAFEVHLPVIH